MSHDSAHAQMDVKFRSLLCVGLKWVTQILSLRDPGCPSYQWTLPNHISLTPQWAGVTPVVGGVVFQYACSREVVPALVLPTQPRMGPDQVWAQVRNGDRCPRERQSGRDYKRMKRDWSEWLRNKTNERFEWNCEITSENEWESDAHKTVAAEYYKIKSRDSNVLTARLFLKDLEARMKWNGYIIVYVWRMVVWF